MLIKIVNGTPEGNLIHESTLPSLFPSVSFPRPLTNKDIESFGYAFFKETTKPTPGLYEKVIEGDPIKLEDGSYEQSWIIVEVSSDEKKEIDNHQAFLMREQRNFMLTACDWTQLPNAPVDSEIWINYRQALRDITLQEGFPHNITWPSKPQ